MLNERAGGGDTVVAPMEPKDMISLIAQVTTSFIAIVTALAAIVTNWKVSKIKDDTGIVATKLDVAVADTGGKLDAIHEIVNSNLTKVKSELLEANQKIEKLQAMFVELAEKNKPHTDAEKTATVDALLAERDRKLEQITTAALAEAAAPKTE